MALQAALTVQIPPALGGLSGSACYLVTSSRLPTSRLLQISEAHPLLSPSVCGLANIHTLSAPNAPILTRILSETLPNFLKERTAHPSPIKLLVIDALAELFHVSAKTSSSTLVERSKNISEISTILHSLASTYQLAVVVLNEVSDVFDRSSRPGSGDQTDIVYREQVRWFSRAHSIPGEDRKEACLGLVWANQVNVRILLSRTGRRRHQDEIEGWLSKQQKFGDGQNPPGARCPSSADDPTILIRRLSVIFTSVGRPRSLDYIVTIGGISTLPDETAPFNHAALTRENVGISTTSYITGELQVPSLNGEVQKATKRSISDDESEDDYWNDDIPDEIYNSIDLDFLANVTSKSLPNSKIEASPRKTHTKDIFRSPQS
jgi:DNA repair protein RAD57